MKRMELSWDFAAPSNIKVMGSEKIKLGFVNDVIGIWFEMKLVFGKNNLAKRGLRLWQNRKSYKKEAEPFTMSLNLNKCWFAILKLSIKWIKATVWDSKHNSGPPCLKKGCNGIVMKVLIRFLFLLIIARSLFFRSHEKNENSILPVICKSGVVL